MKRIPFEYAVLAISVGVTFAVATPRVPDFAATNQRRQSSRAASIW